MAGYPVHQRGAAPGEQPVPVGSIRATRTRYPVHHYTEAGMARKITIVFDKNLSHDEYAARGNGIWA